MVSYISLVYYLYFGFGLLAINNADIHPVVHTDLGAIQGSILESRLSVPFLAFRGIRYAKSPTGTLRFKPPQPVDPWHGTFDATEDGPMCTQANHNLSDVSEDCLRLNIYTHNVNDVQKPVIFYIHSGGFYNTSGQSKNYVGPQNLMDRGIVLVTINYRLATLGFLSTGTKECPGNNGLKDQVAALKWVHQHIWKFGGDPNSVTLMGYSAGGMSVSLHLVSPMSRGLFHRAIAMSGAATAQWEIPEHQLDVAKRQARLLDCPEDDEDEMIMCFKTMPADKYVDTLPDMFEFAGENPIILWKPVVEKDFGQERFLPDDPTQLLQRGDFARVPIITGITEHEFVGTAVAIIENRTLAEEMDKHFLKWAPVSFLYERITNRSCNISSELRKEFLTMPVTNSDALPALIKLMSDGIIGFGVDRFAKLASKYTNVFYYKTSYVGRFSHIYYPPNIPYGAVHMDETLYLFKRPAFAPMFKSTDPENTIIEQLTRLLYTFALTGNPNDESDEYLKNVAWSSLASDKSNYLEIANSDLKMKNGLYTDRYAVWERLFPLPGIKNHI